jgi:chaperonin GroES
MTDIILVGDRVLVEPYEGEKQTQGGLYLPASVAEKEQVHTGRVIRVGPGYLIPNPEYVEDEPWSGSRKAIRYLPLQAQPGDQAFFLRKEAIEIRLDDTDYLIIPHQAILALVRPDATISLDDLFRFDA